MLFEGEPASGIQLSIILNGEYCVDNLVFGSKRGIPHTGRGDDWRVMRIETEHWKDASEGIERFIVLKPNDPRLVENEYYSHHISYGNAPGLEVNATSGPVGAPFDLNIMRDIAVRWPTQSEDDEEAVDAKFDNDVLSWNAVPGADRYLIEISRVERRATSTSFFPVVMKTVVDVTVLPLSELKSAAANHGENEFKLESYAFDDEGKLLTQTAEFRQEAVFMLPDGVVLAEDILDRGGDIGSNFSQEDFNALSVNDDRLDAVDRLIQDGLPDMASALLDKIEGSTEPGKLLSLQGYLAASLSDCKTANMLFNQARVEADRDCVLDRYRFSQSR